jgi:hypothetical protein
MVHTQDRSFERLRGYLLPGREEVSAVSVRRSASRGAKDLSRTESPPLEACTILGFIRGSIAKQTHRSIDDNSIEAFDHKVRLALP